MTGKLNKNIGFSLLPFAFIFLFDPGMSIVDPLPDFIGYTIMCIALSNLSDISTRIQEAISGFRKGILISLMRMIAIYLLNSYFIESELSVGLLLFVFVFSFFELFVLIPAFRCFFEGLLSLGITNDGSVIYYKKIRRIKRLDGEGNEYTDVVESNRNITEKAYFLTFAFLCIKALAVTLPEFTSLTDNTSYEFISLLRLFGILISLPIGIIWLINMLSFISKVRRDRPFINNLSTLFIKNAKEKPNLYVVKRTSMGLFSLLLATALSVNFYSNYVDLVPDFVFYLILILSSILLSKFSKKWKAMLALGICGSVVAYFSYYSTVSFHEKFTPTAVKKSIEAYNMFYQVLGLQIAESVIMISTVVCIVLVLWDIYRAHSDISTTTSVREKSELKNSFVKSAIIVGFLCMLASLSSVYYVYAQPFYSTENWFYYYSAIISIVINLMSMFSMCYFIGFVNNSVKYKYRLEL